MPLDPQHKDAKFSRRTLQTINTDLSTARQARQFDWTTHSHQSNNIRCTWTNLTETKTRANEYRDSFRTIFFTFRSLDIYLWTLANIFVFAIHLAQSAKRVSSFSAVRFWRSQYRKRISLYVWYIFLVLLFPHCSSRVPFLYLEKLKHVQNTQLHMFLFVWKKCCSFDGISTHE